MEAPNSIHDLIKTLMDTEKPFPPHLLHYFSDIQPEDRRVLANAWQDNSHAGSGGTRRN